MVVRRVAWVAKPRCSMEVASKNKTRVENGSHLNGAPNCLLAPPSLQKIDSKQLNAAAERIQKNSRALLDIASSTMSRKWWWWTQRAASLWAPAMLYVLTLVILLNMRGMMITCAVMI
eukprot:scaffold5970_cov94-Skeletonema_dohrnii-CCMP3373.AAC.6